MASGLATSATGSSARRRGAAFRRTSRSQPVHPRRVLIDAAKLLDRRLDGVKRYLVCLLEALQNAAGPDGEAWHIDVALGGFGIYPLRLIVESLHAGDLRLPQLPRVLRNDSSNPIDDARACLARSDLRGGQRVFQRTRVLGWRMVRSFLKRRFLLKSKFFPGKPYDLLHLTLPNTSKLYHWAKAPPLATVHDLSHLACPELQFEANNDSLAEGLEYCERRGARYLAVSAATRDQMSANLGIDPARISVVHNGICHRRFHPVVDPHQQAQARNRYGISDVPFLLSLGTVEPRKNLIAVVRAFCQLKYTHPDLPVQLVLAGAQGWGDHEELHKLVAGSPHIRAIGYVEDDDLPALYSASLGFAYLSLYEGFGLPLLEAMACGVPVIHSNCTSLPEVAGAAGLSVNPTDVSAIAQQMCRLASDAALRRHLSERALSRSQTFHWDRAACQTLACYTQSIHALAAQA